MTGSAGAHSRACSIFTNQDDRGPVIARAVWPISSSAAEVIHEIRGAGRVTMMRTSAHPALSAPAQRLPAPALGNSMPGKNSIGSRSTSQRPRRTKTGPRRSRRSLLSLRLHCRCRCREFSAGVIGARFAKKEQGAAGFYTEVLAPFTRADLLRDPSGYCQNRGPSLPVAGPFPGSSPLRSGYDLAPMAYQGEAYCRRDYLRILTSTSPGTF